MSNKQERLQEVDNVAWKLYKALLNTVVDIKLGEDYGLVRDAVNQDALQAYDDYYFKHNEE